MSLEQAILRTQAAAGLPEFTEPHCVDVIFGDLGFVQVGVRDTSGEVRWHDLPNDAAVAMLSAHVHEKVLAQGWYVEGSDAAGYSVRGLGDAPVSQGRTLLETMLTALESV